MGLIIWLIIGLIAGAVARGVLPGPDPFGLGGTLVLGLAGSFVGGFLGNLIGPGSIFELERAGLFGSIIGAIVVLLGYRALQNRASAG